MDIYYGRQPGVLRYGFLRRAGISVFDPTTLPSLVHRWRASTGTFQALDGTGAAGVGDPVGTWTDDIGGVDLIAPSEGARPELVTVGSTPVLDLAGTGDYLSSAINALGIPNGGSTIWGVVTYPTNIGRAWDRATTGNVGRMMVTRFGGTQLQYYISGRVLTVDVPQSGGDWMVPCSTVDSANISTYLDGAVTAQALESVGSGIADLRLGASNTGSAPFAGRIVEILVFDEKLTATEVRALQAYAHATYGDDLGVPAPPTPFDASDYGSVISAYTAREQEVPNGASVPSLADVSGNGNTVTAPAGSNEGTYNHERQTVAFDGTDFYRGTSKSPFDSMHQTPEGTLVVRILPTSATSGALQTYFATSSFSTSGVGINVCLDDRAVSPGTNRLRLFVSRGVGGTSVYDTIEAGLEATLAVGVPVTLAFAWDATDVRIYQDGVLLGTDTPEAEPPSASTSAALPEVGASNGSFRLEDELNDLIVYADKLNAATIAALTSALEAEYV